MCRDVTDALHNAGHDVAVLTGRLRRAQADGSPPEPSYNLVRELELYWDGRNLISPSLRRRCHRGWSHRPNGSLRARLDGEEATLLDLTQEGVTRLRGTPSGSP